MPGCRIGEKDARVPYSARSREVCPQVAMGNFVCQSTKEETLPLAIAGTGYGVIGLLVIVLIIVLIIYFARRA